MKAVVNLHSRGLVHGSLTLKSFAVDMSGNLFLGQFEDMKIEDPNSPFRPSNSPTVAGMAFMAPELLQSLRRDGVASLTKATDIYSLGCLGYEVRVASQICDAALSSPPIFTLELAMVTVDYRCQALLKVHPCTHSGRCPNPAHCRGC